MRVIPETGSRIAPNILFNNLVVKSNLNSVVIDGLLRLNFVADEKEKLATSKMLIEQAGICAWNLNAFYHCPVDSKYPFLKDQLDAEYRHSIRKLFDMLKLIYDKNSIEAVLENLEAGTGQSISYAVELLDTFMDEDLKPYIVPLLEDTSLANKLWSLENYFPLRHYEPEELLKAIINRDNNIISKQTKIYALNAFQYVENKTVNDDLVAQLFNTDKFLRQLSAQIIENIDKGEYLNCKKRLNDKLRVELDRLMDISKSVDRSVIDRINFYKSIYSNINPNYLLFLLYNASIIKLPRINLKDIEIFRGKQFILFVEQGQISIYNENSIVEEYGLGKVLNTAKYSDDKWRVEIEDNTVLHYIELDRFVSKMYDNAYLLDYVENL